MIGNDWKRWVLVLMLGVVLLSGCTLPLLGDISYSPLPGDSVQKLNTHWGMSFDCVQVRSSGGHRCLTCRYCFTPLGVFPQDCRGFIGVDIGVIIRDGVVTDVITYYGHSPR